MIREPLATTLSSEPELATSPASLSMAQLSGAVHNSLDKCSPSISGSYGSEMVFGEILESFLYLRFEDTDGELKGSVKMEEGGEGGETPVRVKMLGSKEEALGRPRIVPEMALTLMMSSMCEKSVSIVRIGSLLVGGWGLLKRDPLRALSFSFFGGSGGVSSRCKE